jgi:hypothetical protein
MSGRIRLYCACGAKLEKDNCIIDAKEMIRLWRMFHSEPGCRSVDAAEYKQVVKKKGGKK